MRDTDQHPTHLRCLLLGLALCAAIAPASLTAAKEPPTPMTGEQVYNNVCVACHSPPGIGGAPALGDTEAWAPRIAQGMETLVHRAVNGFTGSSGVMPKKGQRLDLSDEEVAQAVAYMVGQVTE